MSEQDMPLFSSDELLQFARGLSAEVRRSGLDYRVTAASALVDQLTEVCLREAAAGHRITPLIGGADEPRSTRRLVAQL